MKQKTIKEIAVTRKEYKRPYVKQSTMAAYVLILEDELLRMEYKVPDDFCK